MILPIIMIHIRKVSGEQITHTEYRELVTKHNGTNCQMPRNGNE
jgi:hypothetical protein